MGVNNTEGTIKMLTKRAANFTIHLGDISYADDAGHGFVPKPSSGNGYDRVYDAYQNMVEPIASTGPYMTVVGNHDVSCHATGDFGCPKEQKNFTAYRYRFRMPSAESGAYVPSSDDNVNTHHNMWHSWRVGRVHFVGVSTESDFPHAPTQPHTRVGGGAGGGFHGNQLAWLRANLAAAAADPDVRWIVAIGHRPWYTSASVDWPLLAPRRIQASFEPLLHEFGVDLWLCGHKVREGRGHNGREREVGRMLDSPAPSPKHFYERNSPAYNGRKDSLATMTIVNGAAGNNEGIEHDHIPFAGRFVVASNYKDTGYGELSVLNATMMRWQYLVTTSEKDGGDPVYDEVFIPARASKKEGL